MDLSPNIFHLYAPIKLISLNHAFVTLRNGRRCRSKNYVKFAKEISSLMSTRTDHFKAFNDYFNPLKHEVHGYLEFYTELYTKKGTISKNSSDIDNVSKPLLDNVLTDVIDDSQLVSYTVKKIQSYTPNKAGFFLRLEIVDRVIIN